MTTSSPVSGTDNSATTPSLVYEMTETHGSNNVGISNVDLDSGEDESITDNDSNGGVGNTFRSTSSVEGGSTAGDNSSVFFRREGLASKETRAVTKLKLLVFGSLFFSMVAVALTAYFLTS
jgi:hypothetical protein